MTCDVRVETIPVIVAPYGSDRNDVLGAIEAFRSASEYARQLGWGDFEVDFRWDDSTFTYAVTLERLDA